jgi:hypothetical protein
MLVALGTSGVHGRVAAQDHPAGAWFAGDEAEPTPAGEPPAEPSPQGDITDDQPAAADVGVQAAQLSYEPAGDPIAVCAPRDPNNPEISVGGSVW